MGKAKAATADAACGAKGKAVEATQNTIAEIKGLEPVLVVSEDGYVDMIPTLKP